jgi:hypothetical protein
LIRRSLLISTGSPPAIVRLRAVLGRLSDDRPISETDLTLARSALPALIFNRVVTGSPGASAEALARENERWQPEAAWGGLTFAFVPLTILP